MPNKIKKENYLLIAPSIASVIGLNESIILQQLHYWLDPNINKNFYEEKYWVYNTYEQWLKQFPFWSVATIKRTIISLEHKGIIISSSFNKDKFNRTKWYSINYNILSSIIKGSIPLDQNDTSDVSKRADSRIRLIRSYKETETTTENTTENTNSLSKIDNPIENKTFSNEGKEREMLDIWNKIFKKDNIVVCLTDIRSNLLKKAFEDYFLNDLCKWERFCLNITTSKFLMGEVTNFKVSLDWALKEDNLIKILENNYGIKPQLIATDLTEYELEEVSNPIWKKIREELRKQLGEGTFKSWVAKLKFSEISNQVIYLEAPTKFIKEWILEKFRNDILRLFERTTVKINNLEIFVKKEVGV